VIITNIGAYIYGYLCFNLSNFSKVLNEIKVFAKITLDLTSKCLSLKENEEVRALVKYSLTFMA